MVRGGQMRRTGTAVVTGLLFGLLATGCSQSGEDTGSEPAPASRDAFCRALADEVELPASDEGDVIVYLDPVAGEEERNAVEAALRQSDLVADLRFVDQDAAFEKFEELFRDNEEMLGSVTPADLPTSFEVDLEPGWSDADAAAFLAELRARDDVYEIRAHGVPTVRVFDALVLTGSAPSLVMGLEADLAEGPAAETWTEQVDTVQDEAEPEVADAVELLAATLDDQELPAADGSAAQERIADAAETLVAAGEERCDLQVPGFLEPEPGTGD